jgi:hypothetical protein
MNVTNLKNVTNVKNVKNVKFEYDNNSEYDLDYTTDNLDYTTDNLDYTNYEPEPEPEKYWESSSQLKQAIKPKKVTFPDILSNMNLVVKNGVLQQMGPLIQSNQERNINQERNTNQEITPDHSYIYNKYFKDYANMNQSPIPEIKIPKTITEYKQMLHEEKVKQLIEKKRIANIKSTKLLFTNNPINTTIKPSINNLRKMSFN